MGPVSTKWHVEEQLKNPQKPPTVECCSACQGVTLIQWVQWADCCLYYSLLKGALHSSVHVISVFLHPLYTSSCDSMCTCRHLSKNLLSSYQHLWRTHSAGLMLGHRRRRWPNIKPALDQHLSTHITLYSVCTPYTDMSHIIIMIMTIIVISVIFIKSLQETSTDS